ncbi:hypothetical protein NQZ68_007435 [Dissostichus eleginoides]|nr:hypothetical protein NQZ68_007435 [Dissostichus eleginoides]
MAAQTQIREQPTESKVKPTGDLSAGRLANNTTTRCSQTLCGDLGPEFEKPWYRYFYLPENRLVDVSDIAKVHFSHLQTRANIVRIISEVTLAAFALQPKGRGQRYERFDVRLWALGIILEYCLSGLKAAAPVVSPHAASDSAAAPLSSQDGISVTGLPINSPLRHVLKPRSENKTVGSESGRAEYSHIKYFLYFPPLSRAAGEEVLFEDLFVGGLQMDVPTVYLLRVMCSTTPASESGFIVLPLKTRGTPFSLL